jgi:hypothetical protein
MPSDEKIILVMKQGPLCRDWISDLQGIPDQLIRNRLLSFFYYMAEFEFMARFQYWTPPRLLTGDDAYENVMRWTNSSEDFNDAYKQVLDAMLCYVVERSDTHLQAMSSIAAAVLERHNLPLLDGLDDALKKPTRWEKKS